MTKQEVIEVEIEKLIPYEKNNKFHNDKQVKELARSIKEL